MPATKIQEIQFVYLETHNFTRSEVTQTIDLKQFGIKMYLPPDSFSESTLHITVGVVTSGSVIIPENMPLVSAIYYVKVSSKLLHPVTVELEHCVTLTESSMTSGLTFGKADTSVSPPYMFKKISNGTFGVGQSWGTIEMSDFCLLGIFWCANDEPSITYIAGVLSRQRTGKRYEMFFLAGRNLGFIQQVSVNQCAHFAVQEGY